MAKSKVKDLFLVIDGNSLFFRAYYAYPQTLSTADGTIVNAVYGFMTMFFKAIETYKPRYLAIAFDYDRVTFRKAKIAYYKAQRKETDASLIEQYPYLFDILDAFNIPMYREKGFEADDFLGTFAEKFENGGFIKKLDGVETGFQPVHGTVTKPAKMLLVTGDKDLKQAVSTKVDMLYITGTFKNQKIITVDNFKSEYNFEPQYFDDYLAICGDSSDNIPGVKGIGQKGARELVEKFGSLENMYENIEKVNEFNPRYAKLLVDSQQESYESKFLTTLETSLDIDLSWQNYLVDDIDPVKARKKLQSFGFRSLLGSLENILKLYNINENIDIEDFSGTTGYKFVSYDTWLKQFDPQKPVSIGVIGGSEPAVVANSLFDQKKEPRLTFWACQDKKVTYSSEIVKQLSSGVVKQLGGGTVIVHDLPAFLRQTESSPMYRASDQLAYYDLMLASYLYNPGRRDYLLKTIAAELVQKTYLTESEFAQKIGQLGGFSNWSDSLKEQWLTHTAEIYDELYVFLTSQTKDWNVTSFVRDTWEKAAGRKIIDNSIHLTLLNMEQETALALRDMEDRGICVDINGLEKLQQKLEKEIRELEESAYKVVGHEFNLASPKQVSDVLFKELGIGGKQRSTRAGILEELVGHHPVVEIIIKHRELSKMYSTYVKGFEKFLNTEGEYNVIHTDYRQTAVITGRLSSVNPNLQNIPIKSELGRDFRKLFVPRKGFKLITMDYSQIELRVLAYFSNDKALVKDFKNNLDIHASTAARIFDKDIKDVSKAERRVGKTINFGIIYGLSPFGLAKALKIDTGKAAEYIQEYFEDYEGVKIFFNDLVLTAKETGYVETAFGRRRYMPYLGSGNKQMLLRATREAMNMPIQGTAADIMKLAMINVHKFLRKKYPTKAFILLQIHDELVLEIADDVVKDVSMGCEKIMENSVNLNVPLNVDCGPWTEK
ncbi:DNA polymerase I [Candidatus Dojkabacteria bacterium]|nr:DNA polymerase I [Candidatus Dojkabacteria bacterium]